MSVVTIAEAWPAAGRPFTVAELDRMPDDGRRYELLDGVLIVSPRPTTVHQLVAGRLYGVLSRACPDDLCVVPEPAVVLDREPGSAPAWANRLRVAGRSLRSYGESVRVVHRRPSLHREYYHGRPDPRPASLTGVDRSAGAGTTVRSA
jgi:hypothetical protein